MFRYSFGICSTKFDDLQLYRCFVLQSFVSALGVMESKISEEPLRVGDVDQSGYEATHPVVAVDARV